MQMSNCVPTPKPALLHFGVVSISLISQNLFAKGIPLIIGLKDIYFSAPFFPPLEYLSKLRPSTNVKPEGSLSSNGDGERQLRSSARSRDDCGDDDDSKRNQVYHRKLILA